MATAVALLAPLLACAGPPPDPKRAQPSPSATLTTQTLCEEGEAPPLAPTPSYDDQLSPTRLLRRVVITLTGHGPTDDQYAAMQAATSDAAREQVLSAAIDEALASPAFYDQMLAFGHDWLRVGRYTAGAANETYWGHMSGSLLPCAADTANPGALIVRGETSGADAPAACDTGPVVTVEPWWAPGTTVRVVGRAGNGVRSHPLADGSGEYTCGLFEGAYFTAGNADEPGSPPCGCGPNLIYCHPGGNGFEQKTSNNDELQRRMAWDEPARLLAHIAWHDRPLSDLVLGDYSVGPNKLRHLYVRHARQNLANVGLDDSNWWQNLDEVPADPHHDSRDPLAWREFVVESVHPHLLSDRDYHYDPRDTTEPPLGFPAAGVLTMMGSQSSFARERVRAARWLEIFACKEFSPPPSEIQFNAFDVDPATSGTCQHCHTLIDPAAIFFKRWDFGGHYIAKTPLMPGIGDWLIPTDRSRFDQPYARWTQSWLPNTVLTPVTEADIAFNPYAIVMDMLPSDQRLLGLASDGTVGPLGFGKILVESGEFDRCASSRLAERILGRRPDPGREAGYAAALTRAFVESGRQVKPFVRHLLGRPEMRRGL